MGFYDLSKKERTQRVAEIQYALQEAIEKNKIDDIVYHFSDEDTYIRKVAYKSIGRIYNSENNSRALIIKTLEKLLNHTDEHVRQTAVNAAGEIGMFQFEKVQQIFDTALFDEHHKVRNAVIGSLKKMGQKNPKPSLTWARSYLHHGDKEVRREICHGIELRGRTHPQDVLPLLKELQHDDEKRVRTTLVHVIGQISYKKGCLPTVISELNNWKNKSLVRDALDEIVDVHSEKRYAKFTAITQEEVIQYITNHINE